MFTRTRFELEEASAAAFERGLPGKARVGSVISAAQSEVGNGKYESVYAVVGVCVSVSSVEVSAINAIRDVDPFWCRVEGRSPAATCGCNSSAARHTGDGLDPFA
ncbi:unnamed protein product [Cylicostephanus goldi]|uniref:Uncharacterized protein n=1 Tax=Cylicostephanus goldi TaxID=71465 RepID=A0A3P6QL04_CYLGO|nr:unnamed protein product [Cylicostephanus goldi]